MSAYDRILERVKPGSRLRTPDERVGQPFVVDAVDAEGVSVKTAKGGKVRIGLFTFETATKFLADRGVAGDREVEDGDRHGAPASGRASGGPRRPSPRGRGRRGESGS